MILTLINLYNYGFCLRELPIDENEYGFKRFKEFKGLKEFKWLEGWKGYPWWVLMPI